MVELQGERKERNVVDTQDEEMGAGAGEPKENPKRRKKERQKNE